jgi:Icc-related predicted phosphoesterase
MRALVVSDLHYTLKQLDWVVQVAGDYDLVVVAGDLLNIASPVEPDAQIAVVLEYLARIAAKTSVVTCSGNHDLDADNDLGERSAQWLVRATHSGVAVDGGRFETEQVLLTVCAWWDGPLTRDVVDRQLADDALVVGDRRWIWAYHAPPDESPTSWTGRRHYGDADLGAWIEKHRPDFVLCGHVHQSPFATEGGWIDDIGPTVVVNAGRQSGPVPTFVELDLTAGRASWHSAAGVEERALLDR